MSDLWTTLAHELGDRTVSDLRAENGPVGSGVILKRLYLVAKPASRPASSVMQLRPNDEFWSVSDHAFMRFERWSKKGNAVARRAYGLTGAVECTVQKSDIEIWDERNGWSDNDGWTE